MHCFFYCLDFYITTAPKIFAISSRTDKNSCHNFARLSVWCFDWVGHHTRIDAVIAATASLENKQRREPH